MRARARALAIGRRRVSLQAWGASFLTAGAALWASAMAPRLEAQLRFGPICSAHGLSLGPHCPACYAAAAFAAMGVACFLRARREA